MVNCGGLGGDEEIISNHDLGAPMNQKDLSALELRKTDDRDAMKRLCIESGLEDGDFACVMTSYAFYDGRILVGCASLKVEGDRYSVDWFAVSDTLRRKGLGSELIRNIENEARQRGAAKLWALARAPGFFRSVGFRNPHPGETDRPQTDGCARCRQFHRTCFPEVLVKDLKAPTT
jgi:N-acetylglutamate synthase-like GNAT family acetyltransferase